MTTQEALRHIKKSGMSYEYVAEKLGFSKETIVRWANNKTECKREAIKQAIERMVEDV